MRKATVRGLVGVSLVLLMGALFVVSSVDYASAQFGGRTGEGPVEGPPEPPPSCTLSVGNWVRVVATEGLRVRSFPRIEPSTRIGTQPFGATGHVVNGPVLTVDGTCMVQLDYTNAPDGWSIEGGLEVTTAPPGGGTTPPPPPPPPPGGGFTLSSVGGDVVPVNIQGGAQAPSRGDIDNAISQVRSFFQRESYGSFTPSLTVSDPVTITLPAGGCGSRDGSVAAMNAAAAAAGSGKIFIIPGCLSLETPEGRIVAGSLSAGTIAHEIGHELGFAHAASAPGAAGGDPDDIMGNQFFGGGTLPGVNVVHKVKARWLTAQPVTQSGSYSLVPYDVSTPPGGTAALEVTVPGRSYRYFISRKGSGSIGIRSNEATGGVTGTDSVLIDPSVAASQGVTVSSSGGQVQITISDSGGTPPPPGGPTGSCPGRVCEPPLVTTEFGSYMLTCPASTEVVEIPQNGIGSVQLMAVGTYADGEGAQITVPVRGGTRFTPNIGIRSAVELGLVRVSQSLPPGGILDFKVYVGPEVPANVTYSVPMRATVYDFDYSRPPVESRVAKYSYCNVNVRVTPLGSQPSAFGRIYSFVGAGTPVTDMRTQPGQTVQIHWSSAGVSACYLKVNGQSRALPSGFDGTRGGSFTSDPVRAGVDDTYELRCQVSGAPPGELTAPAYFTLGPAGGAAPAPGELVITLDAQGDPGTFYGTVPKDEFGRVIDFVHVRSGGMVTFYWTSRNAASCNVSPTGATTRDGGSGISGIEAPFDIRVTCTGTSGEVKSKAVRVVMNPGEPVTGQPPRGSLSCDPFRKGYNPGSTFSIRTRTTGATGNLNFEVSMVNPADNPIIDVVSNLTNRPAGENTIDFRMRPLTGGKNSGSIFITLTAKDSGGGTVGSCLTIADVGTAGNPPADQQTLQQQQSGGTTPLPTPPPAGGYSGDTGGSPTSAVISGAPTFQVGDRVQTVDGIRVRRTPNGPTLTEGGGLQARGAQGRVTAAAQYAGSRWWVNVDYDVAPDGWSAAEYLVRIGGGQAADLSVGSSGEVTVGSNTAGAGTCASIDQVTGQCAAYISQQPFGSAPSQHPLASQMLGALGYPNTMDNWANLVGGLALSTVTPEGRYVPLPFRALNGDILIGKRARVGPSGELRFPDDVPLRLLKCNGDFVAFGRERACGGGYVAGEHITAAVASLESYRQSGQGQFVSGGAGSGFPIRDFFCGFYGAICDQLNRAYLNMPENPCYGRPSGTCDASRHFVLTTGATGGGQSTVPQPPPPPPPPPPASGASVRVVSPNGGEVFLVGSGQAIRWEAVNPPLGFSVGIDVVDASGGVVSVITPKTNAVSGVNSYGWIVPSSVSQGSYRVRVTCRDGASCSDSSDGTFMITKSGSSNN